MRRFIFILTLMIGGVVCTAGNAAAVVLYDGSLNTAPSAQGWLYLTNPIFGASATVNVSGGATTLDTTAARGDQAGFFSKLPPFVGGVQSAIGTLDRNTGFELAIDLRIESEGHNTSDRGGFSVIILSDDKIGLETAFWTDEVWAYDLVANNFVHHETAMFDTTQSVVRYAWLFQGNAYTITADGSPILSGLLRDYTPYTGSIDPYEIPNFIFFGDDTSSADARVHIERIELYALEASVPEPATLLCLSMACGAAMLRRCRRGA